MELQLEGTTLPVVHHTTAIMGEYRLGSHDGRHMFRLHCELLWWRSRGADTQRCLTPPWVIPLRLGKPSNEDEDIEE